MSNGTSPKWLQKLERRLPWLAVSNIASFVVGLQFIGFVLVYSDPSWTWRLALIPELVLQGEIWRLLTFLALPISLSPFLVSLCPLVPLIYCRRDRKHVGSVQDHLLYFDFGLINDLFLPGLYGPDCVRRRSRIHALSSGGGPQPRIPDSSLSRAAGQDCLACLVDGRVCSLAFYVRLLAGPVLPAGYLFQLPSLLRPLSLSAIETALSPLAIQAAIEMREGLLLLLVSKVSLILTVWYSNQ